MADEFNFLWLKIENYIQNRLQWGRSNLVDPRGVAENSFTKPGFWEHFVDFSQERQQNIEFTKFSLGRTPEVY